MDDGDELARDVVERLVRRVRPRRGPMTIGWVGCLAGTAVLGLIFAWPYVLAMAGHGRGKQ